MVRAAVVSLGYLLLLIAVYMIHARYFTVDVVFYSALLDVFIASLIAGGTLWLLPWVSVLGLMERIQLIAIWLLTGYALAISVPTVIDRSLSFYILEKLDQRGGGIQESAFPSIFREEYLREHRLVDVRLTEQLQSRTIQIHNGCVELTPKGRRIARFSRMFRTHFLPRHRLLMGEYTDALTDPFRSSQQRADYRCQPEKPH